MRTIDIPPVASGHAAPITNVALQADGRLLATSSYDGSVIIWDTEDPGRLRPVSRVAHRRLVNAAAWNPVHRTLLATASADKTAVVWELDGRDAHIVSVLARHTDDINSVAWLPDGRRLACASEDGDATLWDALSGRFLGSLISHTAHCMMVACSADGLVASVGEDGMVAAIDPDEGTSRSCGYAASVEGCAWSHSGKLLAVARDDGLVDLLDRELSLVRSIPVSSSAARTVAWSEGDHELVVGAYDGAVHFLGADGTHLGRFDDDRLWPRSVAAARGIVAVGSFWSTPYILDQASRSVRLAPVEPTHGPNAMTVRGPQLVIGCDSGAVVSVDVRAGVSGAAPDVSPRGRVLSTLPGPVLSLAACGGDIAVGTFSGRLGWIGEGGRSVALGDPVGAPVPSILCQPDRIVGGTYDGELVAIDRRTLAVLHRQRAHEGSVKTLASLGGEVFVSGATDRSVAIGTLTARDVIWEHGNLVNSVAVLDGRGGPVVASASRDHTVKVGWVTREPGGRWRVDRIETLIGPDESVKCVGLLGDPEAPTVIAGSYDFGLYAWRVGPDRGGAGLRRGGLVRAFGQGLSCICSIDARAAAVAAWDGRVAVVALQHDTPGPLVREVLSVSVPQLIATAGKESAA